MRRPSVVVALASLVAAACTPAAPPLEIAEGCQPLLGGADCLLPFPSDYFLVDDADMPSGKRVQITDAAKLLTADGDSADVYDWRTVDGASRVPFLATLLGGPIAADGTVGVFDDQSATQSASSKTMILEAATGRFVPHFVDVDPHATDPARAALVLHPATALAERTRYVVVVQGVVGPDGNPAPPAEGYRRLRDGIVGEDPLLAPHVAFYDDVVWPALDKAGVARDGTQIAWAFTTGSDARVLEDMLRARELALEELQRTPPVVQVQAIFEDEENPAIWRLVHGTVVGPLVTEFRNPPTDLHRDDDGRVALNGTTQFEFTAVIPRSVRDSEGPGALLQFGHGFFGTRDELEEGPTPALLDGAHAVGVAIDWWGMSGEDIGVVVGDAGDLVFQTLRFGERVPQGMVNWLTITEALTNGSLAEALAPDGTPAFKRPTEPGSVGIVGDNAGALVWDDARVNFMGISMGHILGGVVAALNPSLERVVLNVGGAAFTTMMWRAIPFERFAFLFEFSLPDPLDQQKLTATMQPLFDRFDPAAYARYVLDDELPSGPTANPSQKRVLLQTAIGDTSVPNVAAYLHARLLGIPLVVPSTQEPWGLERAEAPVDGSGIVTVDFGVDDSFYATPVFREDQTPAHASAREAPEVQAQIRTFLATGVIEGLCDDACVLELP